jgi:hypothetical protein
MRIVFNPFTNTFDYIKNIPQVATDPTSPNAEDAWVLKTGSGATGAIPDGTPIGLLLSLTYTDCPSTTTTLLYQFSYRTQEGTTIRAALS